MTWPTKRQLKSQLQEHWENIQTDKQNDKEPWLKWDQMPLFSFGNNLIFTALPGLWYNDNWWKGRTSPGSLMWVGWFLLQVKNEVGLGGTQLKWKCSPTSAANLPLDFTEGGEGRGERRVVGLKSGKWSHVPQMSNSDSVAKFGHCVSDKWVPARNYMGEFTSFSIGGCPNVRFVKAFTFCWKVDVKGNK